MRTRDSLKALALLLPVGCASSQGGSDAPTPAPTGTSEPACVDGPPRAVTESFPYDPALSSQGLPRCPVRCGAALAPSRYYSVVDLPAGSCAGEQACQIGAEKPCDCEGFQGPVSAFRCACTGGQWACVMTAVGTAVCPSRCGKDGG